MKNDVSIIIRAFDKTGAGTGSASANLRKVKIATAAAAGAIAAMAAAAAFAAVKIGKEFIKTADETSKLGRRLGVSTEALSTYRHAAELTGVEFGTLATGLQRMTRRVSEAAQGTGEAKGALAELGVSARELNKLAPDQQFERIADAMQGVENQSDKIRLAMKLFDTEGVALLQTMEGGAKGLRAMQEEARALGLEISTNTGAEAERLNDNLLRMRSTTIGLANAFAVSLLPALNESVTDLNKWVTSSVVGTRSATILTESVRRLGSALALTGEIALISFEGLGAAFDSGTSIIEGYIHLFKNDMEAWNEVIEEMGDNFDEAGFKAVNRLSRVKELMDNIFDRGDGQPLSLPQIVGTGNETDIDPFKGIDADTNRLVGNMKVATQAVQGFQGVSQQAITSFASGLGAAVLNAQNLGAAVVDLSKGIAQMFINYIAQRLAMFAVEKTMAGIGMASAVATAGAMGKLGGAVAGAWVPAAVAVSLATFGANSGPAVTGMFAAFAAGTAMAAGAAVAGGLLSSGGGLAGQAHSGLDMVPREGTYLLNRGEAVIQPEANQDLREMARSYNSGRGSTGTGADGGMMAKINLILDGEVLASGIGRLAKSGILEIHPKAVR